MQYLLFSRSRRTHGNDEADDTHNEWPSVRSQIRIDLDSGEGVYPRRMPELLLGPVRVDRIGKRDDAGELGESSSVHVSHSQR